MSDLIGCTLVESCAPGNNNDHVSWMRAISCIISNHPLSFLCLITCCSFIKLNLTNIEFIIINLYLNNRVLLVREVLPVQVVLLVCLVDLDLRVLQGLPERRVHLYVLSPLFTVFYIFCVCIFFYRFLSIIQFSTSERIAVLSG